MTKTINSDDKTAKKLKIALCCDNFYPNVDGVVETLNNYAKILSKKHDVTVFVPESTDKNYVDNFEYKVVRCKNLAIKFGDYVTPAPALDKKFKKELSQDFDIVHLHSPFTVASAAIKCAKKRNIPIVITLHSLFKQDFFEKTKSKFLTNFMINYIAKRFNSCDELWTMNPKMEELSHTEYKYKGKVFILPNGSDLKKENVSENEISEFRKNIAKNDEKILLFVGRIHVLKNIEFIINVCERLKQKGFKFKMVFVGAGQDFDKFKKLTKSKKLDDTITFTGKILDRKVIQKYYAVSDLFVFPSKYDTDGIVKNEAAAFYTPTIFLRGSVCASIITDNENGFLSDEDIDVFADRIIEIFNNKETYNKVCEKANKQLFKTWDEIVAEAEKEYMRVISAKKNK